jgi:hypothetical protein
MKDKPAKKAKLISNENKVKSDEHKVPVQKDKYEKLLNKKRKISETNESNAEQVPGSKFFPFKRVYKSC